LPVPLAWDGPAAAVAGRICRRLDGIPLAVELLYQRAQVMLNQGQHGAALPSIESGLGLARRLQEPHLTARLLSARSFARNIGGNSAGAARDATESLRLYRQAGDRILVGATLGNLGNYELSTGDLDAARRHLAESVDIARALNARDGMAHWTFNLGLAEYLSGSPEAAQALFAEALDLARHAGIKGMTAYALIGLAMAVRGRAEPGWSARLHGAGDQALRDLGETLEPLESRLADLDRQRLRAAMGTEAFEAEYAAGRALDLVQVLAAFDRPDATAGQARTAHEARPGMQAARAGELASKPEAAATGEAAPALTPRELEVLKLVAQGLSNPDIAQRLILSEHTVRRHLANILRKLDLSSRTAAAAWGVRTGLI